MDDGFVLWVQMEEDKMKSDNTFTIECTMRERWIPHFLSMLKYMEQLGGLGGSRKVAIYSDGDVDQRERSRKETETELRDVKAAGDYWHSKWKEACENARIKHKEVCELKRERNRLIDKLDDLQASTIHSCGDSCSRPMCALRRERDAYKEALEMIAYDGSFPKLDCQKLADATLTEIEVSKEGEAK